jgi:branched-chain amino acid transport system substrate-binding protein
MRMAALMELLREDAALKSVYLLGQDYSFGQSVLREARRQLAALRPDVRIAGDELHPLLRIKDFAPYMAKIKASGAQAVITGNFGPDLTLLVKAAREFGLTAGGMKIAALGMDSLPAIKSASLDIAQDGMYVTPWHPGISPEAQAFMDKFIARKKTAPSTFQVGTYSAVLNYLKAVQAVNTTDPKTVIAQMRKTPVKDAFTNAGTLRADGRMVHDVYLVQIKKPAESKGEWDLIKVVKDIPGAEAFRPLADGGCAALPK